MTKEVLFRSIESVSASSLKARDDGFKISSF